MPQVSRVTAKTYFNTGDIPTETQFADTLDSVLWYDESPTLKTINSVSLLGSGDVVTPNIGNTNLTATNHRYLELTDYTLTFSRLLGTNTETEFRLEPLMSLSYTKHTVSGNRSAFASIADATDGGTMAYLEATGSSSSSYVYCFASGVVDVYGNLKLSSYNTAVAGTPVYSLNVDASGNVITSAVGGGSSLSATLAVGATTGATPISFTTASGTNRAFQVYARSAADNLAIATVYPSTGTDVGQYLQVVPKGTGGSGIDLWASDLIADSTNYSALQTRWTGADFIINSMAAGTGTVYALNLCISGTTRLGISAAGVITISNTPEHADNAAATGAGLVVGNVYRTGDLLKIVH